MNLADTINKVRRKVSDYYAGDALQQKYTDDYYEDAIEFGLGRLNGDLETSYSINTVPSKYEWVVVLLASIEMCNTRAFEESSNTDTGAVKRLEVEGYESEFYEKLKISAKDWLKLAEDMEKRYQDWLQNNITEDLEDAPEFATVNMHIPSLRKGGAFLDYVQDRGIPAPTLTITLNAGATYPTLSWSAVYDSQFATYAIRRIEASGDWETATDVTEVVSIPDNHTESYKDRKFEQLASGDYVYRLVVINLNGIEKYSEAEVTKP